MENVDRRTSISRAHPSRMLMIAGHAVAYAADVAALAIADALFDRVEATAAGLVLAAAVIAVPQSLAMTVARIRRDVLRALIFGGLLLPPALVAIADAIFTNFDVQGFGPYVATTLLLLVVGCIGDMLVFRHRD